MNRSRLPFGGSWRLAAALAAAAALPLAGRQAMADPGPAPAGDDSASRLVEVQPPSVPAGTAPADRLAALAADLAAQGYDVLPRGAETVAGVPLDPAAVTLVVSAGEQVDLQAAGLSPRVLAVGRPFAEIQAEAAAAAAGPGDAVPLGYPALSQVLAQMQGEALAHPDLAQYVDLTAAFGQPPTFEGRHLYALRISDHVALDEDEPALLVVAAHHCRELVTPVIALDIAHRLLANYGSDPAVTAIVDANDVWICPVWNPDGYDFVFTGDNLWRKNRRIVSPPSIGVDLNRNYPFGWGTACSGATQPSSSTYKGPSAGSEAETQTLVALASARRFAKVIDWHSYGREVLFGYLCLPHPFATWLESEAAALSIACNYGGSVRAPSAEGEEQETQLATRGAHAFLVETALDFQPPYAFAVSESALVWPGFLWMAQRAIPVSGHVTDACTHEPLAAAIGLQGVAFPNGEGLASGGPFGRFDLFVPDGNWTLVVSAPGHATQSVPVTVPPGGSAAVEVALAPLVPAGCIEDLGQGKPGTAGVPLLAASGALSAGSPGTLSLAHAAPSAEVALVIGLSALDAPFKGGVLVPHPDLVLGLASDAGGGFALGFTWPAGVPAGTPLWLAAWVADAGASFGLAASNALRFTAG